MFRTISLRTTFFTLLSALVIFSGCSNSEGSQNYYGENDSQTDQDQTSNINKPVNMKTTPEQGDTVAVFTTSMGEIKILLYTEEAPLTTQNFIDLANEGLYDGTIFHRIIDDFMVQGGDIENKDGLGGYSAAGPGTNLEDEIVDGLVHIKGALSMANKGFANSGGSQFFIVQKSDGTDWLDGKHAVFGYAFEGMDIIDQMAAVEVDGGSKPLEDIVLEKVEITTY